MPFRQHIRVFGEYFCPLRSLMMLTVDIFSVLTFAEKSNLSMAKIEKPRNLSPFSASAPRSGRRACWRCRRRRSCSNQNTNWTSASSPSSSAARSCSATARWSSPARESTTSSTPRTSPTSPRRTTNVSCCWIVIILVGAREKNRRQFFILTTDLYAEIFPIYGNYGMNQTSLPLLPI